MSLVGTNYVRPVNRHVFAYLKPLWYIKAENLRKLKDDWKAVRAYLNKTEEYLTKEIDFVSYMVNQ